MIAKTALPARLVAAAAAAAGLWACALPAQAAPWLTDGLTFTVASPDNDRETGSHFHATAGGIPGNPAGKAEVGRYFQEEVRGLSEFDLNGLGEASLAVVSFQVFRAGGLARFVNGSPFTGFVLVDAYLGNNQEDLSDYEAPSFGRVARFLASPTSLAVGDTVSLDITEVFNRALLSNAYSLGIRLRPDRDNADDALSLAWTFDAFQLASEDRCAPGLPCPPGTVPAPTTALLVALGAALGLGATRRQRRRNAG